MDNHYGEGGLKVLVRILQVVAVLCIIALVLSLLFGCTTAKKATRYMNENEAVAAAYCATRYPVRESVTVKDSLITDTVTIEAPVHITDTLFLDGKPVVISKPCPPSKTITQTRIQTIERVRTDSARLRVEELRTAALSRDTARLAGELRISLNEADRFKEARDKWFWRFCILAGVFGIALFLRIKRIL